MQYKRNPIVITDLFVLPSSLCSCKVNAFSIGLMNEQLNEWMSEWLKEGPCKSRWALVELFAGLACTY